MSFAQYFDHGLDFVVKGGNGTIPIGGVGSGGADNPADLTRATITGWDADGPQHLNQTSPSLIKTRLMAPLPWLVNSCVNPTARVVWDLI